MPPPPLNTAVRLPKAHRPSHTAVSVTAESSPPPSTSIHGHPLVGVTYYGLRPMRVADEEMYGRCLVDR